MNITLNQNDCYLVEGPAVININSGSIEAIAANKVKGQTIKIPKGKKLPIMAIEETKLEFDADKEAFTKLEQSSIPQQWDEIVDSIVSEQNKGELYKIVVLGEVDTGKTFFCTYLANRLQQKVGKTAILDCDSGQSDIGCSGTYGMIVLNEPEIFLTELKPDYMYLIGAHSPGLHFLPAMTGIVYMLRKAQKEADVLVVDTTGWVQGDGGRAIKKAKLDILMPHKVILMQREGELEHLVKHLPENSVVRVPVSKKASITDQMDRKALRENVSRQYFKDAKVFEIPFSQVYTDRCYFLTGKRVELEGTLYAERLSGWEGTLVFSSGPLLPEMTQSWPKDSGMIKTFIAGQEKGLMISLLDEHQNTLAIARLEEFDFLNEKFRLRADISFAPEKIKGICFGSLKITENGEEAGFIEPGSF